MPPKVVTLTTSSIVLEFQAANRSAFRNQVEYARAKSASVLDFVSGSYVTVIGGKRTYQVLQENLIPGATYHIRVVPLVRLFSGRSYSSYRGIPSDIIKVMIPIPGRVCIIILYLLLRFARRTS